MNLSMPGGKRELIEKAGSSIFITVAISSVVVAFCLVAINFMWDQASYNSRVHAGKEAARDTLLANIESSTALIEDFNQLEAGEDLIPEQGNKTNSAVILDALPRRYDFPALRTSIDKLADSSSVRLNSFNGNDEEGTAIDSMIDPVPQEIRFSVSVEGSYKNIKRFITNVENTIRPIEVIRLRLAGSDGDMNATFDMLTFYQPSVNLELQTRSIE